MHFSNSLFTHFFLLGMIAIGFGGRMVHGQEIPKLPIQQAKSNVTLKEQSLVIIAPAKSLSKTSNNIGAQAAMMASVGLVKQPKLGYVGAALVGITTIMNNNDNDGRPATYTGGDGSNFAAGG